MTASTQSLDLLPGDCLLYKPHNLFGLVTAIKTWSWVSHVEVYIGEGWSVASRDGQGVARYKMRTKGLCRVLRPLKNPDKDAAMLWFYREANGQKYDLIPGMLCFYLAAKHGSMKKMFCSEFATRFYRHAGLRPFNPSYDADRVAPAQFLQSPAFEDFWRMI